MGLLETMPAMQQEWRAWQTVVHEFSELGLDINDSKHNRLVTAICRWGEYLHALRANQTPDVVEKAMANNNQRYEAECTAHK